MNTAHFRVVRNTSLPFSFREIHFELARDPDHPEGSPSVAYTLLAPLQRDDRLDVETWHKYREAYRVIRRRPGQGDAYGHLVRGRGGSWRFEYEREAHLPAETGVHFKSDRFGVGDYISIREAGAMRTYRITASHPL